MVYTPTAHPLLLTVEGIDGSGKDTQIEKICEWLRNDDVDAFASSEPNEKNEIGAVLRSYLKDGKHLEVLAQLFVASQTISAMEWRDHLERGKVVVQSRSHISTLVYQQDTHPYSYLYELTSRVPITPKYAILVDLPVDEALGRIHSRGSRREHYEKMATLKNVAARYRELSVESPVIHGTTIVVVDGQGSVDDVFNRILNTGILQEISNEASIQEVRKMPAFVELRNEVKKGGVAWCASTPKAQKITEPLQYRAGRIAQNGIG